MFNRFWKDRRSVGALLGICLAVAGNPVSAQTSAAADATADSASVEGSDAVENWLAGVTTLRAAFRQRLLDERGVTMDESAGTLYLSRPDRFRWEYLDPFAEEGADDGDAGDGGDAVVLSVVADGERLWVYDADLSQATVKRMDDSLASNPAMLLSGRGKVSDGFTVTGRFEAQGVAWTELAPRERDTDFQTIRLGLRDGELAFMELRDSLDQVTQIEFASVERNVDLVSGLFVFDVPKGVDVIGDDPLYDAAVDAVQAAGRATSALLQERLGIDAQRAAGLIVALRDGGVLAGRDDDGGWTLASEGP